MRNALTLSMLAAAVAGCTSAGPGAPATGEAVASLSPAASGGPTGLVTFRAVDGGTQVHVAAAGLVPGSVHGFHVHEKGNCASADFLSAGGHFNPQGHPHGAQSAPHHAGDMPNLDVDAQGRVDARFTVAGMVLDGPEGIVGHAVILHAGPDDYQTQPTGNSGARLACGVIAAR